MSHYSISELSEGFYWKSKYTLNVKATMVALSTYVFILYTFYIYYVFTVFMSQVSVLSRNGHLGALLQPWLFELQSVLPFIWF